MQRPAQPREDLDWLLDDLLTRLPLAERAVVLSADGLPLGASSGLGPEEAEHMSAMAAGFQSLAKGASRHFAAGPVRQTVVEMESAYLFVTAAGQGACLAVLCSVEADMGLVAYEVAILVDRVGELLVAPTRPPTEAADAR